METHGVGLGCSRKASAGPAPITTIAELPQRRLIRRDGSRLCAAFSGIRIAQRQPRRNRPTTIFKALERKEKGTRHCGYGNTYSYGNESHRRAQEPGVAETLGRLRQIRARDGIREGERARAGGKPVSRRAGQ